jgi:uncharacterized protein YkwD
MRWGLVASSIVAGLCVLAAAAGAQSGPPANLPSTVSRLIGSATDMLQAPAQAADGGCADEDARAGSISRARLASSLTCLIDQQRRADGLSGLNRNADLRRAAADHAHDMLVHGFFGHRSSSGATVAQRAKASGYMRGARSWEVGEALHWGDGKRSTPRHALRELLNSPPHRAILMSHRLRDIGVAAVTYTRSNGRKAAKYVVDMGRRS